MTNVTEPVNAAWKQTGGPILLVMAAGMGSRYGGLKQIDPVGPSGETILDYSLFDAKRAGFRRVIFLIKHEIEEDFRRVVLRRIEGKITYALAFQQMEKLPEGFAVPEGRAKPWGTGHAVLCCRSLIDAPFAAINADDYYGVSAFKEAYDFLSQAKKPDRFMMVGYRLRNTLTDSGYVARGVCDVDEDDMLRGICERTHIIASCDGPLFTEDGAHYERLDPETLVSMNLWGFTPTVLDELAARFPEFLRDSMPRNPLKAEFFLPSVVDAMLKRGEAVVQVLPSQDKWFGVTYQADKPVVMRALAEMSDSGLYPKPLW